MSDHAWRRDALGGSDAPALVGVDPFRTAGDIWAEKTGRVPVVEEAEAGGLNARALGSALEGVLLDAVEHRLRRPLARQIWYRHPTAPMACSVDGLALDAPALLVDGKTAGLLGPSPHLAAYGDDGTDDVPQAVNVQIHHAFAVLDAQPDVGRVEEAWIPALLGGRGFRVYRIRRDDQLVRELLDLEADWWHRYVEGDRCPPDDPPSLPVLRAMRRRAEIPPRPLDEVLVGEWLHAKAVKAQAEKLEETTRRFVLADLGDGEVGECMHGRVTYFESERAGYTVGPTRVRSLRFKAAPAPGARKVA